MKSKVFSDLLIRQKNMKIELKDMKAHQNIIGDDTFKNDIKKSEKKKIKNLEEIFDKGSKDKGSKKYKTPCGKPPSKCKCKKN